MVVFMVVVVFTDKSSCGITISDIFSSVGIIISDSVVGKTSAELEELLIIISVSIGAGKTSKIGFSIFCMTSLIPENGSLIGSGSSTILTANLSTNFLGIESCGISPANSPQKICAFLL